MKKLSMFFTILVVLAGLPQQAALAEEGAFITIFSGNKEVSKIIPSEGDITIKNSGAEKICFQFERVEFENDGFIVVTKGFAEGKPEKVWYGSKAKFHNHNHYSFCLDAKNSYFFEIFETSQNKIGGCFFKANIYNSSSNHEKAEVDLGNIFEKWIPQTFSPVPFDTRDKVTWDESTCVHGYYVYASRNGCGFEERIEVSDNIFPIPKDWPPGDYFFMVSSFKITCQLTKGGPEEEIESWPLRECLRVRIEKKDEGD